MTNKTTGSFEVRELGGGTSTVSFDYRITAIRRNYEKVRFADDTAQVERINQMQDRLEPKAQPASDGEVINAPPVVTNTTLLPQRVLARN